MGEGDLGVGLWKKEKKNERIVLRFINLTELSKMNTAVYSFGIYSNACIAYIHKI